nr:hypothetical protein [Rhizobium sp. NZLR5]
MNVQVDRPAQSLLETLHCLAEIEHVDIRDDHQIDVAVRPIVADRNRPEDEGHLNPVAKWFKLAGDDVASP